jgi:hypothetical protein
MLENGGARLGKLFPRLKNPFTFHFAGVLKIGADFLEKNLREKKLAKVLLNALRPRSKTKNKQ